MKQQKNPHAGERSEMESKLKVCDGFFLMCPHPTLPFLSWIKDKNRVTTLKEKKDLFHVECAFRALIHTGFAVDTFICVDDCFFIDNFDCC